MYVYIFQNIYLFPQTAVVKIKLGWTIEAIHSYIHNISHAFDGVLCDEYWAGGGTSVKSEYLGSVRGCKETKL